MRRGYYTAGGGVSFVVEGAGRKALAPTQQALTGLCGPLPRPLSPGRGVPEQSEGGVRAHRPARGTSPHGLCWREWACEEGVTGGAEARMTAGAGHALTMVWAYAIFPVVFRSAIACWNRTMASA